MHRQDAIARDCTQPIRGSEKDDVCFQRGRFLRPPLATQPSLLSKTAVSNQLSTQAKQSFQVVALFATVLVVGIHYKSAVPNHSDPGLASLNELAQEFLLGGIARVAVPVFAFAAGLFYFLSDDGTLATYRKKLRQRCRTLLLPYLIVGSVAMLFWAVVRVFEGKPFGMEVGEFFGTWLFRPPAEQLWFLRDLMVLVLIAPAIGFLCRHRVLRFGLIALVGGAWIGNQQFAPIVMGWHALHLETLLFFVLGCVAAAHPVWIERAGQVSTSTLSGVVLVWFALVATRVGLRPNFDIWYNNEFGVVDLILHQTSILVGGVCLFGLAWRMRFDFWIQLSGASFFVYLVHEFPLRAVVARVAGRVCEPSTSCWIVAPVVIVGCYAAAVVMSRLCPSVFAIITGGRGPTVALPRIKAITENA